MFGRIFGRGKDEPDSAVCAHCGRTLLAGEWTQQYVDDNGDEKVVCSLCAQSRPVTSDQIKAAPQPANAGRVRESRSDSDAFWKALKEKDTEIERLQALLARAEAEKQELAGRLARIEGRGDESEIIIAEAAASVDAVAAVEAAPVAPALEDEAATQAAPAMAADNEPELASATWGETPAELAAALAEFDQMGLGTAEPVKPAPHDAPAVAFDDTQPIPTVEFDLLAEKTATESSETENAAPEAGAPPQAENVLPPIFSDDGPDEEPGPSAGNEARAAREAEAAASLTLLQRGVDLLNVSTVPRKIVETNENLGLSSVHVGFDGSVVAVTFLWSMGWYRYHADIDSGDVRMDDRGYDQRHDLLPNATVRADGTVQLAPAQITKAAVQRMAAEPVAAAEPVVRTAPESPRVVAQKPPEWVSKSLLGQRSDDEPSPWDEAKARDFNWDR